MDYFDEPYWNLAQVLAWVMYRDRALIERASDNNTDFGTYSEEAMMPNGEIRLIERRGAPISFIDLACEGVFAEHTSPESDLPNYQTAKAQIMRALEDARLSATAIAVGSDVRLPVGATDWLDLDIYFDLKTGTYAGWKKRPRIGDPRYRDVKIARTEILSVWPDPFTNIRVGEANQEPPEHITDDELQGWLRHDSWTALQAIFLLHGKKPRNAVNSDDEIFTHFVQAHVYLQTGLEISAIGKKVTRAGADEWVGSPANWYTWAKSKGLPLDARIVQYFELHLSSLTKSNDPETTSVESSLIAAVPVKPLLRRDAIWRDIDGAQRELGEKATMDEIMAKLQSYRGITGSSVIDVAQGKVIWRSDAGVTSGLTTRNLKDRLHRRNKKA